MWFEKLAKSYLLIEIFWKFQIVSKKLEPNKDFGKEKRDYPKSVATFPKKNEANPTSGETFSPYKKSGPSGVKDNLKDVECHKCHKKGPYAKNV